MRDRDPVIEAYSASARELAERYETLAGKSPTNLVHRRYRTDVRFRGQRRACRTAETEALCRPAVLPKAVRRLVGRQRTGRFRRSNREELPWRPQPLSGRDRTGDVSGTSVSVRLDHGGRRLPKK